MDGLKNACRPRPLPIERKAMERLKISCLPWWLLKNSQEFTIEYWCSLAAESGLDGVDLMDAFLNDEKKLMWGWDVDASQLRGSLIQAGVIDRWRKAVEVNGLTFSALTLHNSMFCFDEAAKARELDRLCVMMDLARELGIEKIRPVHGWEPIDENWKAEDEEKKLQAIIDMCKRMVPEAAKRKLVILYEPHPQVTLKTENVVRLFEAVEDEIFQLQFDPKHVDCDPAMALSIPALLRRLGGIHLDNFVSTCSVNYNIPLDAGYFRFDEIFLLLRSIDYKQWATIEYSGSNPDHIARSTRFVKDMARKYGLIKQTADKEQGAEG